MEEGDPRAQVPAKSTICRETYDLSLDLHKVGYKMEVKTPKFVYSSGSLGRSNVKTDVGPVRKG
jgi:hypothetical protein